MTKSTRLTIRSHNIEFLKTLAAQMGISDLSEVINYLLLDCKGLGYKFGDKPQPTPQPTRQQSHIGYAFDTFEPAYAPIKEVDRNHTEIDPIIARLSTLIEEF